MELETVASFASSHAVLLATVVSLLASVGIWWLPTSGLSKVPRVGPSPGFLGTSLSKARKLFLQNGSSYVREGYEKYNDSLFRIQTNDMERLIISTRFIPELSKLPESILSVSSAISARHLGRYTTLEFVDHNTIQVDVCRIHLTNDLEHLAPAILNEVRFGLRSELPLNNDWVTVNAQAVLLRLIARTSARSLVGLPLCREANWLEVSMGFSMDVFLTSKDIRPYPNFVRPLVAPFLKTRRQLLRRLDAAAEMMAPLMEQYKTGTVNQRTAPAAIWMMSVAGDGSPERTDPKDLALKLLFISLAAIHTTTTHLVHAILDLCAHPEYQKALREEIRDVFGNDISSIWSNTNAHRLRKLDSFLKESQRINHPGLFAFNRKVMKPIKLSNGVTIPMGTLIGVSTQSIASDKRFYSNPEIFDPMRFYNLAEGVGENKGQFAFVSTSPTSMAFGHGRRACPGRFFAAHQLKLLMAVLLMEYDIKFPDGEQRPKNVVIGEHIIPNREQKVQFKKRVLVAS